MANATANVNAATTLMPLVVMEPSQEFLTHLPCIAGIQPASVMAITDLAKWRSEKHDAASRSVECARRWSPVAHHGAQQPRRLRDVQGVAALELDDRGVGLLRHCVLRL